MKTFDVVDAVIQAHSDNLDMSYKLNQRALEILRKYCDVIDVFVSNHDGRSIEADVIDGNLISISVELFDLIYERKFKPESYIALIERAIKVSFTNVDGEYTKATFIFPTVWDELY